MKNAFGITNAKPALRMVLDGADQLDPAALYDAIQIIADRLPCEDMETLANLIGRAAHQKQLDEGGEMVGVSRQALEELLAAWNARADAPVLAAKMEGNARCRVKQAGRMPYIKSLASGTP